MIVLNCCSLFSLTSLESFLNSNLVLLLKINLNQVILYFRKGQVRSCDSSAVAGHCFIRIESSSVPCFPCGSSGEESACNAGHLGSIPGLGRSPGEGKGYPLQYSGLENSMDRGLSCSDHVADHALIPWLSMDWSHDYHVVIPWLNGADHVTDHALIMFAIIHWSCASGGNKQRAE